MGNVQKIKPGNSSIGGTVLVATINFRRENDEKFMNPLKEMGTSPIVESQTWK